MCIIAGEVRRVARTKLFVMPSADGRRQITVYSNKVDTPDSNVMCLPVPNPSTFSFETVYKGLFADCSRSFSDPEARYLSASLSLDSAGSRAVYLPVQSHGSYEVVLAPTLDDLERVPPGFLTLSDDVKSYLRSNYSGQIAPFGVLLCKLRVGAVDYEPFAYSHAMLPSGELFVPTRHYHVEGSGSIVDPFLAAFDGRSFGGHSRSEFTGDVSPWLAEATRSIAASSRSRGVVSDSVADDWDHKVYTILTPESVAHNKTERTPMKTNTVDWSKMPTAYRHGARFPMRLFERIGHGANEDLIFPFGAPAVSVPLALAVA